MDLSREVRIPESIDCGKHSETCVSYISFSYLEHQKCLASETEYLLTVEAERYVCGFPLPSFQRDLSWTLDQEVMFIESMWLGLPLGSFIHHYMDWEIGGAAKEFSGWLIDGQQRLSTIQRYWEDKFKVFGLNYSELSKSEVRRFMSIKFSHYESALQDEAKIRDLYNRVAFGGTPHNQNEKA
jgi:hypothetical protein